MKMKVSMPAAFDGFAVSGAGAVSGFTFQWLRRFC